MKQDLINIYKRKFGPAIGTLFAEEIYRNVRQRLDKNMSFTRTRTLTKSNKKMIGGNGQHNDMSTSKMIVSIGKANPPRKQGTVHYILYRDGHILNKENTKAHAVMTTLFSKEHMTQSAVAAPNKPKLDQWAVNPFQLNPDRELSGSSYYTAQAANASQQGLQRLHYAFGSMDISLTNFSQVSSKVTIKVWQCICDATNYPQALGLTAYGLKQDQQGTATYADGLESADAFTTGGVTGAYSASNPPSNAWATAVSL